MKVIRGWLALAATLSVATSAVGGGTVDREVGAAPVHDSSSAERPSDTPPPVPSEAPDRGSGSPRPILVQEDQARLADDLQRLAEAFVSYAVGDSDTFPHGESVSLSLGGRQVASIDDLAAALPARKIWQACPADWQVYGAASCPVDLLGPLLNAGTNDASLVYSSEYGDVVCAPTRTGPLPSGRLVVLRPAQEWRTCASDFALVLAADERGRLRAIDLALAEP